jgi:hypothetical protein
MSQSNTNSLLGIAEVSGSNVTLSPGYTALASQLALVQPSSTMMEQYTPTNSAPSNCRTIIVDGVQKGNNTTTISLKLSPNLPAKPNRRLCSCMVERLSCIAGPSLELDDAAQTMQNVCGNDQTRCPGIKFNVTTGIYGAYLGCNVTEQASWALNKFGADQGACSSINGTLQKPTPSKLQGGDCAVLLEQAGSEGTGLVTFTPTAFPKSNSSANGRRMSTAMQVGLAFGAIFILTLVAFFILFKRAQRKSKRKSVEVREFQKVELEDNSEKVRAERIDRMQQLDSSQRFELAGTSSSQKHTELEANGRVELGHEGERHELPSTGSELTELEGRSLDAGKAGARQP